jgi:hypothetical protein
MSESTLSDRVVSELVCCDLRDGSCRSITFYGNRVFSVALVPGDLLLVSADINGVDSVGPVTGEEPHLLLASDAL